MHILRSILVLVACGLASVALAHTGTVSTTPKDGAVLEASPPTIEIALKSTARMTSIVVKQEGQAERKLEFAPKTSATAFKIEQPNLAPGKNEVHWTALAQDGHVTKGVITITIKPDGQKAL